LVFFGGLKKGRLIFGYWVNDSRTHSGLNLPKSGGVPLVVGKAEGLGGDPLEDVIDDRVHDAHGQCCGCGSGSRFYLIRIRILVFI